MFLVEEEAVLSVEDPGTCGATDAVPDRVAANGCQREERYKGVYVELSSGREESSRNQKGVAREEDADEQSRFGKNDCREAEESGPLHEFGKVGEPMEQVGE